MDNHAVVVVCLEILRKGESPMKTLMLVLASLFTGVAVTACSYIEVPEGTAPRQVKALNGF